MKLSKISQNFPYDFRDEEMMSLVKHIVARCENDSQLRDVMSESLSALLIKLTELSRHEEEMKTFRKPLIDVSELLSLLSSTNR